MWRSDGKELFIKGFNDQLYAVSFDAKGDEPQLGQPEPLFRTNMFGTGFPYDVTADGQRFLVNKSEEAVSAPLYLVVNWPADLKKN